MVVLSSPSFHKDISKIKDRKIAGLIEQVIAKMLAAENLSEIGGVTKLSASSNAYRIRFGDYLLGFKLSGNTIELVIFAHRISERTRDISLQAFYGHRYTTNKNI